MSGLLVKKPLVSIQSEAKGDHLRRVLGPWALTALGIGAVIGSGIFVTTGRAAHDIAGPALVVSYVVAGITCLLAALCYAEFASMTPVAGSAYTYAYTTLGEIFAWIIGWDLVLEYAVGASTVAAGWSHYFSNFLTILPQEWGLSIPKAFNEAPLTYDEKQGFKWTGHYANVPAMIIVALLSLVLVKGIRESANMNAVMVVIKVGAVLFVIAVGAFFINPDNWVPFDPYGWFGLSFFGEQILGEYRTPDGAAPAGMLAGAAIIFFAYIGFDAVSTQAEEAKNPQRDVPFGIIASLIICTVLYIGVVVVLTGMVKYDQIDTKAGVSQAFAHPNVGMNWAKGMIAAAALAGLTSVLLVMLLGSARVLMAMSRDGLLPPFFSSVHSQFKTPWKGQIAVGLFAIVMAGLLPLDALLEMTNIGTLFAFAVVCTSVVVMRYTNPTAARPFRCPGAPFLPLLGVAACVLLMLALPSQNWVRLFLWMAIGLAIYFTYGRLHSKLAQNP